MSSPNIFASDFETSLFPGPNGVVNARIDSFVDLLDAITTSSVRDDQKAYAQYYNKMRNALIACQRYIDFDSGTTTCPISNDIWSGDGSVTNISQPYEHTIPLDKVLFWSGQGYATAVTGQVIPFEIYILPSTTHKYKNVPQKAYFVKEDYSWFTILQGRHLASLSIQPYSSPDFDNDILTVDSTYPAGYVSSLSVTWTEVIATDVVIFRGFITDHENNIANRGHWAGLGNGLTLNLSVVAL